VLLQELRTQHEGARHEKVVVVPDHDVRRRHLSEPVGELLHRRRRRIVPPVNNILRRQLFSQPTLWQRLAARIEHMHRSGPPHGG
jgi:hypothetical protein